MRQDVDDADDAVCDAFARRNCHETVRDDVGDDADDAVGDAFARRNCHETVRQDVGDDDDAVGSFAVQSHTCDAPHPWQSSLGESLVSKHVGIGGGFCRELDFHRWVHGTGTWVSFVGVQFAASRGKLFGSP